MPATRLLLKRSLVIALAGLVILAGLLMGGIRLIDHFAPQYRQALADRIGERIGAEVSVARVELRWDWRGPVLDLGDVRVIGNGQDEPAVTLDSLDLHFSFADLLQGRRQPDGLVLDAPQLALRIDDDGRPRLKHWPHAGDDSIGWRRVNQLRDVLRYMRVDNARVHVEASRHSSRSGLIKDLDIRVDNAAHEFVWRLSAESPDWFEALSGNGRIDGTLPDIREAVIDLQLQGLNTLAAAHAGGMIGPVIAQRLSGGRLSIKLDGRWRGHRISHASADIDLTAIEDSEQAEAVLPELSATLDATGGREPLQSHFTLRRLRSPQSDLEAFALTGILDLGDPSLRIKARHLPAALGLRLARLKLARLADTEIAGKIDNLSVAIERDEPIEFGFDFNKLEIDDPMVAAGPISGRYHQKGQRRVLQFNKAGGTLRVPYYLRGALRLNGIDGELAWRPTTNGWTIDARKLAISSRAARLTVNGRIAQRAGQAPVMNLTADMVAPDAPRLLAHIPQAPALPNKRLRNWLPDAIKTGRLESAHVEISGALDRFPFARPREGERFHMVLQGRDVDVAYKPDWPMLENATGRLTLNGDDLNVEVAQAEMLGVTLGASSGHVANVREPVLHVDGRVDNARAQRMLAFLVKSPLRDRFGKLVAALGITGSADLDLDLRIPLKPGLGEVEVSGTIGARSNTLRHKALPGPITGIRGDIAFDRGGLRAQGVHGNLLGVTLRTDLAPGRGDSQRITARVTTTLPEDADALSHYLPRSWLAYASGRTELRIMFRVTRGGRMSSIDVTSDLVGLAIDLPAPLAKAAPASAPLAMNIAAGASHVSIDYDERLAIDVRLTDGAPVRVQALLNDPGLQPPDRDGVWIGGQTDRLDAPGWFRLVRRLFYANGGDAGNDSPAPAFLGGDLEIGQLRIGDRYLAHARVRAQPMHARRGWRIDFEGPNTQGQVTWTRPEGGRVTIAGNVARVALDTQPDTSQANAAANTSPVIWADVSPLELPRLELYIAQVMVDGTDFGEARIKASAPAGGWQLDRFALDNGALVGWASGRWSRRDGMTRASIQTRFRGHGLSRLLLALGFAPTVRAETTRVHSRLAVAPNPQGLDLRALDGEVDLTLDNGTLMSVDPGAARLLGLVNLYVLPRRLRLDFRDVTDEGLAFDSVRAHFNIENGNAYGDNIRIETPSSEIRISGRIGLAARDYDERVTIMPKVGSSAAIAGTVLGGPLVGAAVFAMQELLKEPIQQFSSIEYTLKGSWDDPRISEPRAKQ